MPRTFFTPPPVAGALERGSTLFHRGEWTQKRIARNYDWLGGALALRNTLRGYTPAIWGFRSALDPDFDETDLLPTHDLLDAMMRRGNGDPHWSDPFVRISNVGAVLDAAGSIDQPLTLTKIAAPGRYWFGDRSAPSFVSESSSNASLDVQSSGTSLLIITITRHKYWSATVTAIARPREHRLSGFARACRAAPSRAALSQSAVLWSAISAIALIALIPRRRRLRTGS